MTKGLLNKSYEIFFTALALRIIFILLGCFLDSLVEGPQYTDIDYNVFSDAARLTLFGSSPYERSTYRYPPILAILLIPNYWLSTFGKLLFSVLDAAISTELYWCLSVTDPKYCIIYSWLWVFNIASINICTRGSADSITNYMVVLLLRLFLTRKKTNITLMIITGFIFGLLIYMRIYPIIYLPAFILHIISTNNMQYNKSIISWISFIPAIWFIFSVLISTILLISISYYYYGEEYLTHALLYHISREDHRHNFSIYYFSIYLSKSSYLTYTQLVIQYIQQLLYNINIDFHINSLFPYYLYEIIYKTLFNTINFSSLILFLPQLCLFITITIKFASKNLSICLLLLTLIFVTYNKVITAQYFTWYMCLLPLNMHNLRYIPYKTVIIIMVLWVLTLLLWLFYAYQLEFMGLNVFILVWYSSLLFHSVNIVLIGIIIYYVPSTIDNHHYSSNDSNSSSGYSMRSNSNDNNNYYNTNTITSMSNDNSTSNKKLN